MKNIIKGLTLLILSASLFSCSKKVEQIFLKGGNAPVLTASVEDTLPLSFASANDVALTLNWTNPDYQFTTGPSSQDVNYIIEIDTAGANFTNPAKQTISVSKDLSRSFTNAEFNDYLLNQLVLAAGKPHNLEIRVKCGLGTNNAAQLTSNVLKFTVTPYAIPPKVTPPASGTLFIIGGATPGGWDNPVPAPAQQLTKVSETLYEITIALKGGESYLFIPVNGSWDAKYGAAGSNNSNNVDGDDFKAGGGDLKAPATDGTYKITVDFQRGKFTVTK